MPRIKKATSRLQGGLNSTSWPHVLRAPRAAGFSAPTVAFIRTEEDIQITIDAYKLLGVSRIASEDTVLKAYDRLVTASPDAELSQEMLCSRAVVLKAAADALLDRATRLAYDQTGTLDIPKEDLPGAIAMLAEAGDWTSALEWGRAWLSSSGGNAIAKDVAVCVGIAHCDQAAWLMEDSVENAPAAAEALQAGSLLLRRFGSGEKLQLEIENTLLELKPNVLLQALLVPPTDGYSHSGSITALRELLWKEGEPVASFPGLQMSRKRYLEAVCARLNASEQVQLFEGILAVEGTSDEERYGAALAYLSSGLRTYTPACIKTAIQLFKGLDDRKEPATGRKRFDALDVSVELAVCHLLLGEVDAAEASLGLGDNPLRSADPGVKQFIQSQAGDEPADNLPGMYLLAQQWVAEVPAVRFPELNQAGVDFDAWFTNPRVSLYLQVVDKSKQLRLDSAGGLVRDGAASAVGGFLAAIARLWQAILSLLANPGRLFGKSPSKDQATTASSINEQSLWSSSPSGLDEKAELSAATQHPYQSPPAVSVAEREVELQAVGALSQDSIAWPRDSEEQRYEPDEDAVPPQPKVRQEAGVPLAAVADQTIGEVQQQLQDLMPFEEEDGFSTEYLDAPIPQPPFRRSDGVSNRACHGLLAMEGEREMWASYQTERRRLRAFGLLLGTTCLAIATWAILNPRQFAASKLNAWMSHSIQAIRSAGPGQLVLQAATMLPIGRLQTWHLRLPCQSGAQGRQAATQVADSNSDHSC